ncbi:hypothetical protein FKG94_14300 [Exilibacterium tricleocarpae]|uniref:Uncharacterized protein n=1 Tax=Exilibacterium tricleocarpae TaxID=2591008 RepID=A0A545TM28_9GAMM|nr:hypothetical protein [Exilibacterium tricleocarpae]TQV78236.1 hypothetical protein FKG94_14300 [Exilibacterium tricleocarpae]
MSTKDDAESVRDTHIDMEESASLMAEKAMRENREHMKQVLIRAKNDLLASLADNQFLTGDLFETPVGPDHNPSERQTPVSQPPARPEVFLESISPQQQQEVVQGGEDMSAGNLDDLEALPGLTWKRLRGEGSKSLEKYQQASEQAIQAFNNKVQALAGKTFSSTANIQATTGPATPLSGNPEELMKNIITSIDKQKGG